MLNSDDITEEVGNYPFNQNKKFMSNIFTLNWRDIGSAAVSSIIIALLSYLAKITDIVKLDWHVILGLIIAVGSSSLLKSLGTTTEGKFLGIFPLK